MRRPGGCHPNVCVFRSLKGTDLQHLDPPQTAEMIPVYRRLWEATMEAGLPIGMVPDVHVSLVMLPEECRWLSPRRYPFQKLKLRAMSRVLRRRLDRRWAAREVAA